MVKVQKIVTATTDDGVVMFSITPTSELGMLYELKLHHNDGSFRTSVYDKQQLETLLDVISEAIE